MPEPLQLVVLLVIEELPSGDVLAWPFADPDMVKALILLASGGMRF